MNFNESSEFKKGRFGEDKIQKMLAKRGFTIYMPITAGSHPVDKIVFSKDKRKLIIAEVKTYPKRKLYNDTGINLSHYYDYKYINETYNIPIFLFFIDKSLNKIYGNFLTELVKPFNNYPIIAETKTGKKIYFPLTNMLNLAELTEEESTELCKLYDNQ